MSPYLALFVAGVLTGVAIVMVARLTPDAIAAGQHIAGHLRAARKTR